ncbi:MAG: hypothetical protein AAGB04_29310, partial [Pseudomonadota bacterium]
SLSSAVPARTGRKMGGLFGPASDLQKQVDHLSEANCATVPGLLRPTMAQFASLKWSTCF